MTQTHDSMRPHRLPITALRAALPGLVAAPPRLWRALWQRWQIALGRAIARLRRMLLFGDFEFAEVLAGVSLLTWGAWLLNPWIDTFGSSATFRTFALWPEWVWGIPATILGGWQVWAVLHGCSARYRARVGFAAFELWAFVWLIYVIGNWRSTSTVIYFLPVFCEAWSYWRLRVR